MSQYEGQNLPQLMDLMHQIVTPEPTPWLPQTSGWWVIGGWLLAIILLGTWHICLNWRRNRYRRAALAELKKIEQYTLNEPAAARSIAELLKRTALAAYPRSQVAHLYGEKWARFLCQSSRNDAVVSAHADRLAAMAYRPVTDVSTLVKPARRWIEIHGD